jgi:putative SOS response-associated peptidase YedK
VGERLIGCGENDQREIGNGGHEAGVPRCVEIPQVPDSCRRLLLGERTGNAKQPYCFEVHEGELFAFAGIWDCWKDLSGNVVETCSILTTTPNALTSAVHNRMPVILEPDTYDLWLDPGMRDVAAASELLKPCDARLMKCHPVSSRVNHVANDDAECSKPVELDQIQSGLFS